MWWNFIFPSQNKENVFFAKNILKKRQFKIQRTKASTAFRSDVHGRGVPQIDWKMKYV